MSARCSANFVGKRPGESSTSAGFGLMKAQALDSSNSPMLLDTSEVHEDPFDKFREECGVFALYGHPEASNLVYLGLYALQPRGQESAGIAASEGRRKIRT